VSPAKTGNAVVRISEAMTANNLSGAVRVFKMHLT
jgi:hypothetical protein